MGECGVRFRDLMGFQDGLDVEWQRHFAFVVSPV